MLPLFLVPQLCLYLGKSGERLQNHWSSVFDLVSTCCGISEERLGYCTFCKTESVCDRHVSFEVCCSIFLYKDC